MIKCVLAIVLTAAGVQFTRAADSLPAPLSAAQGVISPPFILTNGYLTQTVETSGTNGGRAVYTFTIDYPNEYAVFLVTETPGGDGGSVFVNIDAEPNVADTKCHFPFSDGFATNLVQNPSKAGPRWFPLAKGNHEIVLRGCDANVKIRELRVIGRPTPPSNLRLVGQQNGAR